MHFEAICEIELMIISLIWQNSKNHRNINAGYVKLVLALEWHQGFLSQLSLD